MDKSKARCVRVNGKDYLYDSRFDLYPYAYFDIHEPELDLVFKIAKSIERRCRKRFKTARFCGLKAYCRHWNNLFEIKVFFSISDEERLAFESQRKEPSATQR